MSVKNVPTILAASAALRARRPLAASGSSSLDPSATLSSADACAAPDVAGNGLGPVARRLMAFLREGGWWSVDEIATRIMPKGHAHSLSAMRNLKRRVSDVLCVSLILGRVACVSRKTPAGAGQFRFVRCYSATDASVSGADEDMGDGPCAGEGVESPAPSAAANAVPSKRNSSAVGSEPSAKRVAVAVAPAASASMFRSIAAPAGRVAPPSEPDSAPRSPRACPVFRPLVGEDGDLFLRLTPVCIPPSPRFCADRAPSPSDSDDVVPATPFELWPTFESVSHAYLDSE
jgi:hypothetical protein